MMMAALRSDVPSLEPLEMHPRRPSFMPKIERAIGHPLMNSPANAGEELDVLIICTDPARGAEVNREAKEYGDRIPRKPTLQWALDGGFHLIERDTVVLSRLTCHQDDPSKDKPVASYSTPAYMRRHVDEDIFIRLEAVLANMLGDEGARNTADFIPWEWGPCAVPMSQGRKNYSTTTSFEVQRGIFHPYSALTTRREVEGLDEALDKMREFNYVSMSVSFFTTAKSLILSISARLRWASHITSEVHLIG
jgi:hypothetical protein